jgi:predicted enzyme related to lactoylglutathione lyase
VPVHDAERAQKFYTDILGWEPLPSNAAEEVAVGARAGIRSMQFFRKGEQLNGAFVLVDAANHVANFQADNKHAVPVLASFCVANCADTLEKVAALGGKTHV